MRKKKIVAVLLTAAMTVTSFLPGNGLFSPVEASAATTENLVVKSISGTMANAQRTGLELLAGNGYTSGDALGVVTVTGSTITTPASVSAMISSAAITTSSSVTGLFSFKKTLLEQDTTSGTGLAFSLADISTFKKAGTGKITLTGTVGDRTGVLDIPITVKTQLVSFAGLSLTNDTTTNKMTASTPTFVDADSAAVETSLVSYGSIGYSWYQISKATADQSTTAVLAALKDVTPSGSSIGTKQTVGVPTNATGYYYAVVTTTSGISGLRGVATGGPITYIPSGSSKSNTSDNSGTTTTPTTPTTTTDANTGATTTTTQTTAADGTQETTTETVATDGTKTTTVTDVKPDGSTTETTTVENADGSKTVTVKENNADGSTKESTEVTNADGSSTLTSTETKADGTVTKTDATTTAAGDTKSTAVTTYPAGSSVKVETTESDVKANGNSVIVVTKENADNTVVIDSETKNSAGETSVTYEAAAGKTNVTVSEIDTTAKSVTIPAKVTAAGKTYKVTKVGAGAMKGNKTATKVTIGKNIKNIGKQAFQNASKMKTVKINGNVTTIGKNSFKGINKKATITIKATKKQYKAMVKKIKNAGGAPAKVTFKRAK